MKEMTLNELQEQTLEILKDIHGFCEKAQINYFVAGGTLIGLIRHKGFIPWDDDADVFMMRSDFDVFCKTYQSDKYKMIYHGNDRSAIMTFARVCECNNTAFRQERPWTDQDGGIWVDILPLDGIPSNNKEYVSHYHKICRWLRVMYKFRRVNHHINSKDSVWSIIKTIVARILGIGNLVPHIINNKISRMMRKYSIDKTGCWGSLSGFQNKDGGWRGTIDEVFPCTLVDFEDTKLYAPKEYDKLMRRYYGDYMQLPPEKDRIPKQYWIKFYWR